MDFLLHAGVLASWWQATGRYWLTPYELFLHIPYGYASFLVYCVAFTWLLLLFHGGEAPFLARGALDGAIVGLVYAGASVLAMYSVVPMPLSALAVWPVSAVAGSSVAGAAAAMVLAARRPWRKFGLVALGSVLLVVVGIVIQNIIGFPSPGTLLWSL